MTSNPAPYSAHSVYSPRCGGGNSPGLTVRKHFAGGFLFRAVRDRSPTWGRNAVTKDGFFGHPSRPAAPRTGANLINGAAA
jgi:hypothetical protein